ncbi:hypothetical protein COOONC_06193 [Cooperia oncophora]
MRRIFLHFQEVGVLFNTGEVVRSSLDELKEAVYSVRCSDKFTTRTTLVAPAHRELFVLATDGGTEALREVALQRTSLACRLWISTLWSSFKNVLVGIAVGDAALPLEKATHSESLNFALLHAPTRTLQQLFERTLNERDYSRAKSLAESYDTIDIDVVLKAEWRDVCQSQSVTVESVDNILRQISDQDWVIETCATSDAPSLSVQKALVDLGTSFPSASLLLQVRLHHNARILTVCEDVEQYIELRNLSCLEAAFRFAELACAVSPSLQVASYAPWFSMSLNESSSKLVAVSSNGDFHLFDIPYTRPAFSIRYISGPRPVQAVFIEDEEVVFCSTLGEVVRSSLDELKEAVYSVRCSDKFTTRTTLVAPAHRELFVLATDGGTEALREVALQRTSLACRLWISTLWSSFKNLVGIAVGDAALPLEKATHSESLNFALLHAPTRTLQQLFERTLNERDYSRAKSLAESYDTIDIDVVLKAEWRDVCQSQSVTVESVDNILQDSAPAHKAKVVQAWCKSELPDFISAEEWPASSPDLNPLDYNLWSYLESKACATPQPIGFSEGRLIREWDEIDDALLRPVIDAFPKRLRAVVRAKGGRIEK